MKPVIPEQGEPDASGAEEEPATFVSPTLLSHYDALIDGGSFEVAIVGHGPPVLLIPGLTCGADVWEPTAHLLASQYELHLVTLSGFAGRPPVSTEGPLLPRVRSDLAKYIVERGLEKPALVGHSLGGFLVLWLASTEPDLVGPVVAVDGLPFLAGAMGMTQEEAEGAAEMLEGSYAALDAKTFHLQNRRGLASMMRDAEQVDEVAETAGRSHPPSVGKAAAEMFVRDLRPELEHITVPVMLVGPGSGSTEERRHMEEQYRAQVEDIERHEVVFMDGTRHFVMFDAAEAFHEALRRFLAAHHAQQATGEVPS